jgi:hypothetical protein
MYGSDQRAVGFAGCEAGAVGAGRGDLAAGEEHEDGHDERVQRTDGLRVRR